MDHISKTPRLAQGRQFPRLTPSAPSGHSGACPEAQGCFLDVDWSAHTAQSLIGPHNSVLGGIYLRLCLSRNASAMISEL
jgi:hypothetical protein